MPILVDTSVWIRFLSNREPYAEGLDSQLRRRAVVAHPMVAGELLIGDVGGRVALLKEYALLRQAPLIAHHEVEEFVRIRKLHGRGIGWVDAHLLASAVVDGFSLWTADARLAEVASDLGLGYFIESDDPNLET